MSLFHILLLALIPFAAMAADRDELKAFPAAEPGMVRHVIRLEARPNEDLFKVELIVGKDITTRDTRNHMRLGGQLKTETIQGWGYDYHILRAFGPGVSTLMAVPENGPEVQRFVAIQGEYLVRYNSRLPIVIYTPAEAVVRYRIWSTTPEGTPAPRS
jgi:ecotin